MLLSHLPPAKLLAERKVNLFSFQRLNFLISKMGIMPPLMWEEAEKWSEIKKGLCKLCYYNYHIVLLLPATWNDRRKRMIKWGKVRLFQRKRHQPNFDEPWENGGGGGQHSPDQVRPRTLPQSQRRTWDITVSVCFQCENHLVPKAQSAHTTQGMGGYFWPNKS